MPALDASPLEFFADAVQLIEAERDCRDAAAAQLPQAQLRLAWYLRQSDLPRSDELAAAAREPLRQAAHGAAAAARGWARLQLLQAERLWLDSDNDGARHLCDQALAQFEAAQDPLGQADAWWLRTYLDNLLNEEAKANMVRVAALAVAGGDARRAAIAWGRAGFSMSFDSPDAAQALLAQAGDDRHPAVQAWREACQASIRVHRGDVDGSHAPYARAVDAALATGQTRIGTVWALNISVNHQNQNRYDLGLVWLERGLAIARRQGGRASMGRSLSQLGIFQNYLGQPEVGLPLLLEAEPLLSGSADAAAFNLHGVARALLATGRSAEAHERLLQALALCRRLDLRLDAHTCTLDLAQACLALGELADARRWAETARETAAGIQFPPNEARALQLLAQVIRAEGGAGSAVIALLQQARALAESLPGYHPEPELYRLLARAQADLGDHAAAYETLLAAESAVRHSQREQAARQLGTLRVQLETERLRDEGAMLRRLGESEARRADELQRSNETLESLGRVGLALAAISHPQAVYDALQRHISELIDAADLRIYLQGDDGGGPWVRVHGHRFGQPLAPATLPAALQEGLVMRCAASGEDLLVQGPPMPPLDGLSDTAGLHCLMLAPLRQGDRSLGVISVASADAGRYGERERLVFRTLCAYGAIALANARAQAALARSARTDTLTGLPNRRALDERLQLEWHRSARGASALSVVLIDIDHFKRINDELGHLQGDRVLAAVAALLVARIRQDELLGRWGGEEFLLVLPQTSADIAVPLAEDLRRRVAEAGIGCTISLGVAGRLGTETLESLLQRADTALYAAKQGGRNRVEQAGSSDQT